MVAPAASSRLARLRTGTGCLLPTVTTAPWLCTKAATITGQGEVNPRPRRRHGRRPTASFRSSGRRQEGGRVGRGQSRVAGLRPCVTWAAG
ncbi:hypothetical protein BRADI_5g15845v3 [Brachypodium distachyon]|uniref:Uncharacterized protein n=1 Tax=Brachypodium distachyon TaxID=15368 RepID=A0A2K2CHI5_BRADI|nr:hypothetical protein BRADI_5g15845v3 [Brachypodium distachyon]